ncbi:porin [Candidatus Curculioniphilus buchneri]|uniref:porin n=1 Tax=Candidatus Curculioniphilus buchneri TaxID=690594 RepID=UPI00376F0FEA
MKLRYFTLLVLSMVASGIASSTEVYNKHGSKLDIYGNLNSTHYLSIDSNNNGDRSSIYYGCHGNTYINNHIVGFGTWEHEVKLRSENPTDKNNCTRLSFAGLKFGENGSLDYGRNYGVLYDIGAWINTMPEFSGDLICSDNFLSGPANSILTYRNANFFNTIDNLNVAFQYQGKNNNKDNIANNIQTENGEGYGLSISYDFGQGVSIGSAYTNSKFTQSQYGLMTNVHYHGGKIKRAEAYSLGFKYDANDLYLAALYNETYHMTPFGNFSNQDNHEIFGFAKHVKNIGFIAQYQLDFGLRPAIGYIQSRINHDKGRVHHNYKKYIEVSSSYIFNKNMLSFVDYRINLLTKDDFIRTAKISTDNILAIGISYTF